MEGDMMNTPNGSKKKTEEFNQLNLFDEPKVLLVTDEHLNIDKHLELKSETEEDRNFECNPICGPLGNCRPDCCPHD